MQKKIGKSTGREGVLKANATWSQVSDHSSAELPGFLTSGPVRKSRKANPSVYTNICASMLVLSARSALCGTWGQAGDQATPAWPEPLSSKVSDQHTVEAGWGQGEGSTPGALSSHTTSLWISSLLRHGPISTYQHKTGAWVCDHHNLLKKPNKDWKTCLNFYL